MEEERKEALNQEAENPTAQEPTAEEYSEQEAAAPQFDTAQADDANSEIAATASPDPEGGVKKTVSGVFDYLELFAWSVCVVLLLFTFGVRLCRVDGQSMENTLFDGQNLLLYSAAYEPKQDDIVVFHLTDLGTPKTLVKRVIATGGQEVIIDTNACTVTVDGVLYADEHMVLKLPKTDTVTDTYITGNRFDYDFDRASGIFKTTVPEGHVFVLGDNRNDSADSRDANVGFVDERCILGKVVLRFAPFTLFS